MKKRLHRLLALLLLLATGLATNSLIMPLADLFLIDKKESEEVLEFEREIENEKLSSSKSGRKISFGGLDLDLGQVQEILELPNLCYAFDGNAPIRVHTQLSSRLYIRFHSLKLDC